MQTIEFVRKADLVNLLNRNYVDNIALIQVARRGTYEKCKIAGSSIRIRDKVSETYLFSISDAGDIDPLLSDVGDMKEFFVNNTGFLDEFKSRFPGAEFSVYNSFALKRTNLTPIQKLPEGFDYTVPDISWLPFIMERYGGSEFNNEAYLTNRLYYSPSLAVKYDDQKVGIVLQHKDGESGPIIVDQKYRGLGIGTKLSVAFDHILFDQGMVTYALVDINNTPSERLLLASNYQKSSAKVFWGLIR